MKNAKLLDSFALIKFFNEEPGYQRIEVILSEPTTKNGTLYLNEINAGEVYYMIAKKSGVERAEEVLALLKNLPIQWISPHWDQIFSSARLKAQYPLSYADCFALSSAIEYQAELVTGDPEFKAVSHLVKIQWV